MSAFPCVGQVTRGAPARLRRLAGPVPGALGFACCQLVFHPFYLARQRAGVPLSSVAPLQNPPWRSASLPDSPVPSLALAAEIAAAEGTLSIHGCLGRWRTLAATDGSDMPTSERAFRRDHTITSRFSSGVVHFQLPLPAL